MEREPQKCKQCGREIYFDGICADCRAENQKKEILALTEEEIDIRIKEICEEIEATGDLDKNHGIFIKLLDYRDINTSKIAETAFKHKVFYPCELYKDASEDIVKSMTEMIKQDDIKDGLAGHLLLCLAAAGGDEVYQTFLELEKHPREWRKKLYVNPSFYATYGGWSYDEAGNFIKTNFDKCYPMVKGTLERTEQRRFRNRSTAHRIWAGTGEGRRTEMPKRVRTIPTTISKTTAAPINSPAKRKVAAYARVSTDHEEQLTSYEAQIDYYTNYIKQREDWESAGLYADEGITACNTKKCSGFNSMV